MGSAESCASAGSSQPSHLTKETIIVGSHPGNELKDLQFTAAQHGITHSIVKLETLDLDVSITGANKANGFIWFHILNHLINNFVSGTNSLTLVSIKEKLVKD